MKRTAAIDTDEPATTTEMGVWELGWHAITKQATDGVDHCLR